MKPESLYALKPTTSPPRYTTRPLIRLRVAPDDDGDDDDTPQATGAGAPASTRRARRMQLDALKSNASNAKEKEGQRETNQAAKRK